jgi:hypothetical protein
MGIPYVNEESQRRAQEWEARFVSLAARSGVLFVSVWPVPVDGGACTTYEVRLGLSHQLVVPTGIALAHAILAQELLRYTVHVEAFVGSLCAAARVGEVGPAEA